MRSASFGGRKDRSGEEHDGALIEVAVASLVSAQARTESRGAHDRVDFHERDDENWLKHTLWFKQDCRLDYKPVHMQPLSAQTIEPKVRTY